jgi:uncharacterized protein (DUF1330 family)
MKTMQILLLAMGVILFSCKQENTTNVDPIEISEEVDTIQKHLFSTPETWSAIQQDFKGKGKFGSVNFLKFKPMADYTGIEVSDKQTGKTGKEVYQYYIKLVDELLEKNNYGRTIYFGESQNFLVGPNDELWDAVILVEYESVEDFVNFIRSDEYNRIAAPHRAASLDDTRLLPSTRF